MEPRQTDPRPTGDTATEKFSIYNNHFGQTRNERTPLDFLRPETIESGWHVSRNPLKPLNHLDLLRRKEAIAATLNMHSITTPDPVFDENYRLLERHQKKQITTDDVIEHLATQLVGSDESGIRRLLVEYASVGHMEFHPTDVCNLTCQGCTYGHDDASLKPAPINFPFDKIGSIAALRPRSMVIVGGGEPTLYRSGRYRFQDAIDSLTTSIPGIAVALTTNGTYKPEGDWPNQLSWVRVSLDAATADTYSRFRGKRQFDRVVRNFLLYLEHTTSQVGISFVFARSNIHEYAAVARFIFDLVNDCKPDALSKVNLQYRPLRQDPARSSQPFTEAINADDIEQTVRDVIHLAHSSREMTRFLREQTNITAVLGGNSHPPHEFSRCHYSQIFSIVRANGEVRPCFIRVTEPDFALGDIRTDPLERIALNTLYVGARRKPGCDPIGCRQCHVNYVLEKGLSGEFKPSAAPQVMADPMH